MEKRRFFKKSDVILIFFLLLFAGVFFAAYTLLFSDEGSVYAEILSEGKVVKTVALDKDMRFSLPEKSNVVFEIKDGRIRIAESDCPDKICVHTGFIGKAMQTAVCLPNAVSVRIVGGGEDDVDMVVG